MKPRRFRIRRAVWLGALLLAAGGLVAPYLHADRFGSRIRLALERALDRKVEISAVRFNLFGGPGFTLRGVVIHDDPAFGIEPFAYVTSIEARVRFTSLLRGRLEFASLRLEEPSVNLVKTPSGGWNFQPMLNQAATATPPAITVRGGRLNFKLGSVKSGFYVSDTDLEVRPPGAPGGTLALQFSGKPARTDRTTRGFGALSGRGRWRPGAPGDLSLDVNLERSSLGEVVALIHGHDIGVHGQVGGRASFRGSVSGLDITGTLLLSDLHRWDLLPPYAQGGPLNFRGKLDLPSQTLEVETVPAAGTALAGRFRVSNYLVQPLWFVHLTMDGFPIQPVVDVAGHMGAVLPDSLAVDGAMLGAISYSPGDGLRGSVTLKGAKIGVPNADQVRLGEAKLTLDGDRVRLAPVTIATGSNETARLEFDYLVASQRLDLRLSTDSMRVASLQREGGAVPGVPVPAFVAGLRDGDWEGWLRYRREGAARGQWSGALRIHGTQVAVPGLATPLELQDAEIKLQGERIAVAAIKARAGEIELRGEYRYDPGAARPHHVTCRAGRLQASDLENLLMPTLLRPRGFISRTLRPGRVTVPDWLAARRLEGTVEIDTLSLAGELFEAVHLRFFWDGPNLDVPGFQARVKGGVVQGYLTAGFGGPLPSYAIGGRLEDASWKGGALSGEGAIQTTGVKDDLYWNLRADGAFRAQSVVLGEEPRARSMSGLWDLRWERKQPRLDLADLRLAEAEGVLTGQGITLDNEQLRIELARGEKRVRLTGSLNPIRLELTESR